MRRKQMKGQRNIQEGGVGGGGVCLPHQLMTSPLHEEVSAIIMCGGEEGYRYEGRGLLRNGLI